MVERIVRAHLDGDSWSAIARELDAEGVPTARGGRWYPATVRAVFTGQDGQAVAATLAA